MHSTFTLRRIFLWAILSTVFFTACTRISTTDIGAGLIPPVDGVTTMDTLLDVVTDTFDDPDSARVYTSDNMVVGAITNDPLFGRTTASAYFQMLPAAFPFFLHGNRDSIKVDSAVMVLSYKGVYGDSTSPITLRLSEIDLNNPVLFGKSYPANYPFSPAIGTGNSLAPPKTIDIRRLGDSVYNRFEQANNQIRIRLDQSQAVRFIKTYDTLTAYKSDSVFKTFFAGFALTADANSPANALLKFNLNDTNSRVLLYYSSSSTGATVRDTNVARFVFSPVDCGVANRIIRDRSGSQFAQHVATTSKPDSMVYVQTSPGSYVRIKVPGLQSLSNRIIHRAELIAEQVPDDANLTTIETYMLPPRVLLLTHYDSTLGALGSKRNIPNDYIIGTDGSPNLSVFGGLPVYKSINGYARVASYNFDLSRFVQGVITRKDTAFTLRLSAPSNDSLRYTPPYPANTTTSTVYLGPSVGNDIADGRVRLGGGTHSRFRMRLRVVYSRL